MGAGEGGGLSVFLALRDQLVQQRLGDGGWDVCGALTTALDGCIAALFEPMSGERLAVVAVGGYGRREQCLYSDIDIMLLHGGRLPARAVETIFYPLWDANLKVGHAVRTVKDAVSAARERHETLTALMDARLIAGEGRLVDDLLTELGASLKRGRLALRPDLIEAERGRRIREPYQLLDANLKEGRGALRTLHALHWERRADQLAGGRPAMPPSAAERDAHAVLLSARNALHAAAGRPFEVYAYDLRPAIATWLGLDPDTAGRRLYTALRAVDAAAANYWAELIPPPGDIRDTNTDAPSARPSIPGPRERWPSGLKFGFARRTHLNVQPEAPSPVPGATPSSAPLALAVRALDRPPRPRIFSPEEAGIIRSAAGPSWDAADRTALLRLLRAGRRGWEVFTALDDLGWVGRALPEWRHVVAAPQHAPFHLHPLDVHLWRTVLELHTIAAPGSDERWCPDVAAELGSLDDALLAAVLHDIGKGWEGDHSTVGAAAVAAFCRRARFGPAITGTVTGAVRHHLLLPNVATRRDIDDPRVITAVADQAGDLRSLRILYLLSVADSRATGPTVWSPWKASLVRSLFARAADELARRAGSTEFSPLEGKLMRELEDATAGRFESEMVREHVEAMPPSYLTSFSIADLVRHLDAVTPPPQESQVVVDVRAGTPAANVIVAAEDRPGLLAIMSGVFALHNVSVLDGRFFTRADGIVLDAFHVEDALGGSFDEQRWNRVRTDMARALRDELPLEDLLKEKARAYRRVSAPLVPVRVLVDAAASESFTIVEVHCTDRVGILHDIARALFELSMDIRLAKIDTLGREVVDTFYVRGFDGEPVREPARLRALQEAVRARLNP